MVLNFDDPVFNSQFPPAASPTTSTPVLLTSPFTYHGLAFTANDGASFDLYNAALSLDNRNPKQSLLGDSNTQPVFLVSRNGGFTITTSTGRLQVISVFLSAPYFNGGASNARIAGTANVANVNVPVRGCGQIQYYGTETGILEQYAAGDCVVDTLSFTTDDAVGIDSLTVCTAATPGTSDLTVIAFPQNQ